MLRAAGLRVSSAVNADDGVTGTMLEVGTLDNERLQIQDAAQEGDEGAHVGCSKDGLVTTKVKPLAPLFIPQQH